MNVSLSVGVCLCVGVDVWGVDVRGMSVSVRGNNVSMGTIYICVDVSMYIYADIHAC